MDNLKIHDQIDLINIEPFNEIITNNDDKQSYMNDDNSLKAPSIKKQYPKRAARLFPVKLLMNEKRVVPTVPFNCSDLNQMGHTVNGIYLVKGNNNNENSGVNVVLCDFQPPVVKKSSLLSVTENRLGFLNLKSVNSAPSKGIYFFVQRGNGPTMKDGVVRFHKEHLNIGKAMSISTGIFTVPKAGIYYFSFSISKEGFTFVDAFYIYLRVNMVKIGVAIVSPGPISAPATISSTLKLKKGDRVDIWKPKSGTIGECIILGGDSTSLPCHHFTGWLLEEDFNY